jgi:exosortase D (VPLPA-CTERM-specific)
MPSLPNETLMTRRPPPLDRARVGILAPKQWLVLGIAAGAALLAFQSGLRFMVANWAIVEEYSYGWFIPVIVGYLVWQKRAQLAALELRGAWSGLVLVALALLLALVGHLSAIRLLSQYGFVVAVFGLAACTLGWAGTRAVAAPLAMLVFMIPLPQFVLRELSQPLQLASSELGVALMRSFGISVFLEGNVIDLGSYKLQVVEACSGLRYLFPLMVLGFLAAYMFRTAWWKRAVLVLSTVPMTIVINSARIALIGVTVEYWGAVAAEGLLHDVEGWFMFMLCVVLLVVEMAVLVRLGRDRSTLRDAFLLDEPPALSNRDGRLASPDRAERPNGPTRGSAFRAAPALVACVLFAAVAAWSLATPERVSAPPARTAFTSFPMSLAGGWTGRPDRLDREVLATLAVDDYLLADYVRPGEPSVNLYGAWYASQSGGASTHSPRTCIPGGGWRIVEFREAAVPLKGATSSAPLTVNRAVIQKGEQRQLVYYWFSQRGRVLTSEVAVKWYILHDAMAIGRTDGALIRLVTPMTAGEPPDAADRRLAAFLDAVAVRLPAYVPA